MKKLLFLVFRPLNQLFLWFLTYGFTLLITVKLSIVKRQRMSHNNGVIGSGRITLVDNPQFPENDFLRPGRRFPCRLRHAAVSYPDDAALQVYGASLKFADSEDESPLDIEMNTGTISLFWNTFTFLLFGLLKNETAWWTFRNYYSLSPQGYQAAQSGVRWQPESYARLKYHSQTPTQFIDVTGKRYYVKYRLVPENHLTEPETVGRRHPSLDGPRQGGDRQGLGLERGRGHAHLAWERPQVPEPETWLTGAQARAGRVGEEWEARCRRCSRSPS